MTIGEVAARAGIATSAIRFYEREGLLPPADRVNGRRRYDESALDLLAAIRVAREAGFTVGETRTLMTGIGAPSSASERWNALARAKLAEIDEVIERAERMRNLLEEGIACGCLSMEDCSLLRRGREAASA